MGLVSGQSPRCVIFLVFSVIRLVNYLSSHSPHSTLSGHLWVAVDGKIKIMTLYTECEGHCISDADKSERNLGGTVESSISKIHFHGQQGK